MDYAKIYDAFIADRKSKPEPQGYSERHHIQPKSLGGTNDAENVIRLTPEDHYFAHLCLAQIHGGDQWLAVHCMASMINSATGGRKLLARRIMVGVARRKAALVKSEKMSGQRRKWRDQIGTLHHRDGRCETGSRTQLSVRTGVSLASVSRLMNGKQAEASGWFADRDEADRVRRERRDRGKLAIRNVSGKNTKQVVRENCGTRFQTVTEAAAQYCTATGNISRAIRTRGNCRGSRWRYAESTAP